MYTISQTIVDNISEEYINTYLNGKKLRKSDEQQGLDLKHWVDDLFRQNKINVDEFEQFLYNELFFGKRKYIRVYKLDSVNQIKTPEVWINLLTEKYEVEELDYFNILNTIPSMENNFRVAAVESQINYRGQLERLKILFVKYVQIRDKTGMIDSSLYFPVEIDFGKKLMFIKAWNRNNLEFDKIGELINGIQLLMSMTFGVHIKEYRTEHKKVLYNMSQGLISDIYDKIPSYRAITNLDSLIEEFESDVIVGLPLKNKKGDNERVLLPQNVIDFKDEIRKIIEKVVVSDYFYNVKYDQVWNMGVDTIISRIRFNDEEHVLTSLSGEASEMPIFCTKTFMALKKSLEDAKYVERLWIEKTREKGRLGLKYDATCERYLDILILSQIRYTQKDLDIIMEMYESYGSSDTATVERQDTRSAM